MVAPDAKDSRTLSIQGRVRVMIRAPKVAKGEILRKGGFSLPGEGFPPPSLRGRERKPNWTIATRSVRRGTLKAGRHSGRSRPHCPGHPLSAASRVAKLFAVSMGSVFLPHPMHFLAPFFTQGMVQQGQIQDVGSLPRGRFSRPARLPACCPGVLSRASCSYFILAM